MFSHQHYVPVLKWKQGEYQALSRLPDDVKNGLTPLIEVPPISFDFETEEDRKSIDDHLKDFARRLKAKWHTRRCFIDAKYIRAQERLVDGRHFVEKIFDDARAEGCAVIPVFSLSSDKNFLSAVAGAVKQDKRGVALRLQLADFDLPSISSSIETALTGVGVSPGDVDLIVDVASSSFQPISSVIHTLSLVPIQNRWRTFTLVGTSYPASVAELRQRITPSQPFATVQRKEWEAYKAIINRLGTEARLPTFGDYAVAHPDPIELDMRLIKPFAKLRYTCGEEWHIGIGDTVRTNGFGQYKQMCCDVVAQPYFDGASFSAGDEYIAKCAAGQESTGNLTTWVWVSTNRHLTKVVRDLSIFHGPSVFA